MIYRVLPDDQNHLMIDYDYVHLLSTLPENYLIPSDPSPIEYTPIWKPIKVFFVHDGSGKKKKIEPDLYYMMGHLYLSEKAASILEDYLEGYGELLEVDNKGKKGFIFNPLTIIAADKKLSTKHPVGDYVTHLSFNKEDFIFKTDYDGYYGVFVNQEFKEIVEKNGLTGIVFESDLSNIFDRSADSCKPSSH